MVGKKGHACRRMHAIDLRQGVETSVRKQVEKKNYSISSQSTGQSVIRSGMSGIERLMCCMRRVR